MQARPTQRQYFNFGWLDAQEHHRRGIEHWHFAHAEPERAYLAGYEAGWVASNGDRDKAWTAYASGPTGAAPFPRWCVEIELLTETEGDRYPGNPGDRRRFMWLKSSPAVPRDVQRVRDGKPIDWGGQLVPAAFYRVVRDAQLADQVNA